MPATEAVVFLQKSAAGKWKSAGRVCELSYKKKVRAWTDSVVARQLAPRKLAEVGTRCALSGRSSNRQYRTNFQLPLANRGLGL